MISLLRELLSPSTSALFDLRRTQLIGAVVDSRQSDGLYAEGKTTQQNGGGGENGGEETVRRSVRLAHWSSANLNEGTAASLASWNAAVEM